MSISWACASVFWLVVLAMFGPNIYVGVMLALSIWVTFAKDPDQR